MPSAADRWTTCMASPRFVLENADKIPADSSSRFSQEGTTVHEVAAAYLQDREPDPANCPTPIDEDMRWHGWNYAEYVNDLRSSYNPGISKLMVEQKMPLWYYEGRNAVVDAAVFNPESLHIVDYKYGEGIVVSPIKNLQATIYARNIAGPLNLPDTFPITVHIYQPRGRTSSDSPAHTWETTWGEIKAMSDEIADAAQVIQINHRVQGMPLDFRASDKACQWCPAKGFCSARQAQLLDGIEALAVIEEAPPMLPAVNVISVEQLSVILKHKSQIEKWLNDAEEYAFSQLSIGNKIPGFKIVTSNGGHRYWVDQKKAIETLTKQTILKRADLVEESLISPAQVEKLIGKTKFKAASIGLTGKPVGKPTIAPEDDERESCLITAESDGFTKI